VTPLEQAVGRVLRAALALGRQWNVDEGVAGALIDALGEAVKSHDYLSALLGEADTVPVTRGGARFVTASGTTDGVEVARVIVFSDRTDRGGKAFSVTSGPGEVRFWIGTADAHEAIDLLGSDVEALRDFLNLWLDEGLPHPPEAG
jgi:hypothetical protein